MNAKELGAQSAMPVNAVDATPQEDGSTVLSMKCVSAGLTKRELFAAMAMQEMVADPKIGDRSMSKAAFRKGIAEGAVLVADALLAELAKDQS